VTDSSDLGCDSITKVTAPKPPVLTHFCPVRKIPVRIGQSVARISKFVIVFMVAPKKFGSCDVGVAPSFVLLVSQNRDNGLEAGR
jgi:hypothetical protein